MGPSGHRGEACDRWVDEPRSVYAVGGGGVSTLTARTSMTVDDLLADGEHRLVGRGVAPRIDPTAQIDAPPILVEAPALAACPGR